MLNEIILIIFYILILLYSVIIHEVAHGLAALWLGDNTAKYAGRLNLNPLKHIDPWGSIGVPLLMLILSGFHFAFGWAKPVPYNPYNLKNQKWGPALVAFSGPLSNLILAFLAAGIASLIKISSVAKVDIITNFNDWTSIASVISGSVGSIFFELCIITIFWNVILAVFNLIPVPPLDGSKLLFAIFRMKTETMAIMEQFGFIFLLVIIMFFFAPISAFLNSVMGLFLQLTL